MKKFLLNCAGVAATLVFIGIFTFAIIFITSGAPPSPTPNRIRDFENRISRLEARMELTTGPEAPQPLLGAWAVYDGKRWVPFSQLSHRQFQFLESLRDTLTPDGLDHGSES